MPAGSTAPVGETIGLIVENEDEIASVQEQNKGNQPEVSTSDQLELVSNKTEEKPVVQTENIKKEAEEVVLKSEKPVPSFNSDKNNSATSKSSSRIVSYPKAKKLSTQIGVYLSKILNLLFNYYL
jgi:pyruvate dehydrogenase E2 component (dihydrolipoamide acetyltransferase)